MSVKLNTIIYDSALAITSNDTSTIEAYSSNQNFLRAIAPYSTEWIPYAIFYPTNSDDNVGIPAEYLVMTYLETTTIDGSTYYKYEIEFPAAVLSSAKANQIKVTTAFIEKADGLIGVSRYDEDAVGYPQATDYETAEELATAVGVYIAAQLLTDYPSAVEDDVVRVFNTDTDWQFNGTAWIDQDDYVATSLVEHRSDTLTYALRKGVSTSRPTHKPNNTEQIIAILNDKADADNVLDNHYTKTQSESRYVNIDGDTMADDLDMDGNIVTGLKAPSDDNDA